MLFTIIVPIYNVEKYLDKCIKSIMQQDIIDYEVILINDGSSDKSEEIAQKWCDMDSKISYYKKDKNSGLSDTRNLGITLAKGEYILFVDSDDYIDHNILGTVKNMIDSKKRPDILYMGYYKEEGGECEKKYCYQSEQNVLLNNTIFMKRELQKRNLPIPACFAIYKRKLIVENSLFFKTGIYHEDELWSPQILYKANLIYVSDIIFYHYNIRSGSITQSKDKTKNSLDLLDTCEELIVFSMTIEDRELRRLMQNRIAMVYMKAIYIGKLITKEFKNSINRKFPINYSYFAKDKIKSLVFLLNLHLYYTLNKIK